ncbi:hypothetical protein TeGR_g12110 [Tetraparma gracilis]|uniref:Uncharacterized protein n=1 Tax=Tetraparma gracilis TaxID=2962635 RepID=A0ABQ6M539_9STRA|nr:hypothetical protein TeGR_g12110 [Tetraparma gracilis]
MPAAERRLSELSAAVEAARTIPLPFLAVRIPEPPGKTPQPEPAAGGEEEPGGNSGGLVLLGGLVVASQIALLALLAVDPMADKGSF